MREKHIFKDVASGSFVEAFEEMLQRSDMANEIAFAIAEARAKRAMTAREVADAMKTTPQAVYNWEKGKNRPASKNLLALANVLRVDGARFLSGEVLLLDGEAPSDLTVARKPRPREVELAPDAPPFQDLGGRREIELLGISVGGENGDFSLNGEAVERVPRPRGLEGRQVFAVRVRGSSMHPAFKEGDVIYVEKHREPAIGDDGVFEMKPTDEWEAGHAFVKEMVAKGMGVVKVKQWRPEKEFTYRREEIKAMYRVVPRNELQGT